jgi:hypothetical protein
MAERRVFISDSISVPFPRVTFRTRSFASIKPSRFGPRPRFVIRISVCSCKFNTKEKYKFFFFKEEPRNINTDDYRLNSGCTTFGHSEIAGKKKTHNSHHHPVQAIEPYTQIEHKLCIHISKLNEIFGFFFTKLLIFLCFPSNQTPVFSQYIT